MNNIGSLELNKIYNEDCLGDKELGTGMWRIPDKSVDMILCDLPYGTTSCKWDTIIPFEPLWEHYERVIKDNGAIVLTAQQPFTSALVMSNPKIFKYELIYEKIKPTGFLNAKRQPLRSHENMCVFYKKQCVYNPQKTMTTPDMIHNRGKKYVRKFKEGGAYNSSEEGYMKKNFDDGSRYPRSVKKFNNNTQNGKEKTIHPTQKPLELFEYLLLTYTNPGMTVLDNCMGSGTTAIAAINTNRNFIGFELEKEYVDIANKRILEAEGNIVNE